MAPIAVALVLGWWLVALSRAQHLPPPSLSLHPSQGVALGDDVTLRCHLPHPATRVRFCWGENWECRNYKDKENDKDKDTVEFSLAITRLGHKGTYWCLYHALAPQETWVQSDPVELVVTG
ncbi:GPVI protein, partial [Alectura lathami]|nr:GPVI protein [Alectura lathami]